MPDYFPLLAQLAWRRTIREMSAVAGWLARSDWRILESYAIDYAIWRDALAGLKEHGLAQVRVTVDGSGQEHTERRIQPELKALNDADVRMKKAESALGLAPSFRAKIDLSAGQDAENNVLHP